MKIASFFAGEGGFDLAADWMGWETAVLCEIDRYCKYILQKKWPKADYYDDITKTDFSFYRGRIDLVVGGFPCQPYSTAGKRIGKDDSRHLWPEMLRVIREISPPWVVGENVLGITNWNGGLVFNEIQTDLEAEGYEVQTYVLPACGVNAPHRRERIWFVAYSHSARLQKKGSKQQAAGFTGSRFQRTFADANSRRQPSKEYGKKKSRQFTEKSVFDNWQSFPTQSPICGGDDGISSGLVRRYVVEHSGGVLTEKEIDKIVSETIARFRQEAIRQHGNAVVPPLILRIFKAIDCFNNLKT